MRKISDAGNIIMAIFPERKIMEQNIPVNLHHRNVDELNKAVDYALQVGTNYLSKIKDISESLKGCQILEIGPGTDFGAALLLTSSGAKVSIVDRFVACWQDDYHRPLYTALRDRWPGDPAPFDAVLAAGGYDDVITVFPCAIEDIERNECFDMIISNAVLEHMKDIDQAIKNMSRITKKNGWGLHQIDFRDHRDFSRPLEYLLYTDDDFKIKFDALNGECGHTFRIPELESLFLQHGFQIEHRNISLRAEKDYMENFLPRLRASKSRYREWPVGDIEGLSAFYRLSR